MKQRPSLVPILALLLALAFLASACAGTLRDRVRTSALVTGNAAIAIDQDERALYALQLPGYGEAQHKEAGKAILVLLQTVRAYERAAAAWPATMPTMPKDVWEAQALAALASIEHIVEGVPGNGKLLANVRNARAKIGGQ